MASNLIGHGLQSSAELKDLRILLRAKYFWTSSTCILFFYENFCWYILSVDYLIKLIFMTYSSLNLSCHGVSCPLSMRSNHSSQINNIYLQLLILATVQANFQAEISLWYI